MQEATIKSRKRNPDGTLRGTASDNPIADTRVYEVEFPDGQYAEYSANVLAENLYQHIDNDSMNFSLLGSITGHEVDESVAVTKDQGMYTCIKSGAQKRKITTKGWKIQVEWKDGTTLGPGYT